MPVENRLEVIHQNPIIVPEENPWFASEGFMALTTVDGLKVYGRGVPQNTIFSGILAEGDNLNLIINKQPVLHPQIYSQTEDGKQVIGYEDPTLIPAGNNPFSPFKEGILCTQTYPASPRNGVYTNLVYFEADLLESPTYHPITILSPTILMRQYSIFPNVDMVKEGEVLPKDRYDNQDLLFEYADGKSSHIGLGFINFRGEVFRSLHFYRADEDNSEHVSTAGAPVRLEDGRWLLFFNRRRNNEWGISYMTLQDDRPSLILQVYPDWLIRAPQNIGKGPGDQLIAFASCAYQLEDRLIRVLYHVNDNRVYESLIEIKGIL